MSAPSFSVWRVLPLFIGLSVPTIGAASAIEFTDQVSFPEDLRLRNTGSYRNFDEAILRNTTARLVRKSDNGFDPDLAERWTVSTDGLIYTFHLRKEARFSDGSPITADDVAWSLKRMFLNHGRHSQEFMGVFRDLSQLKSADSKISGIQALDEHTLRLELCMRSRRIHYLLGTLTASIFKRGTVPEDEDRVPTAIPWSGPYVLKSIDPSMVSMDRNRLHWRAQAVGTPEFVKIIPSGSDPANRLARQEADVARFVLGGTLTEGQRSSSQLTQGRPILLYLLADWNGPSNTACPGLGKNLSLLLDRESLVRGIGPPFTHHPVPANGYSGGVDLLEREFSRSSTAQNRMEALQAIRKACPMLLDGRLPLNIAYASGNESNAAVIEALTTHLRLSGIHAVADALSPDKIYSEKYRGQFDFRLERMWARPSEPAEALPYLVHLDPHDTNLPASHWVFGLKRAMSSGPSMREQVEMIREFHRRASEEGFMISLMQDDSLTLFSRRWNMSQVPASGDWDASDLHINAK